MLLNGTNYVIAPHHTIYFSCLHKESAILSFPLQQYESTVWPETTTIHWIFSSSDFYGQLCQKKNKNKKHMWHHHGQDFLRQLLLVCGHAKLAFLQMCCKQGFSQPTKHFRRFRCSLQFCRALTSLKKKKVNSKQTTQHLTLNTLAYSTATVHSHTHVRVHLPMTGGSSMVMPWDLRCLRMQASRCTLGPQRRPSMWTLCTCVTKRISSLSLHSGRQSGGGATRHMPATSACSLTASKYTRGSWNSLGAGRKMGTSPRAAQPSGLLRWRSHSFSCSRSFWRVSSFSRSHSLSRSTARNAAGLSCPGLLVEVRGEEVEEDTEVCWGSEVVLTWLGFGEWFWPNEGEEALRPWDLLCCCCACRINISLPADARLGRWFTGSALAAGVEGGRVCWGGRVEDGGGVTGWVCLGEGGVSDSCPLEIGVVDEVFCVVAFSWLATFLLLLRVSKGVDWSLAFLASVPCVLALCSTTPVPTELSSTSRRRLEFRSPSRPWHSPWPCWHSFCASSLARVLCRCPFSLPLGRPPAATLCSPLDSSTCLRVFALLWWAGAAAFPELASPLLAAGWLCWLWLFADDGAEAALLCLLLLLSLVFLPSSFCLALV